MKHLKLFENFNTKIDDEKIQMIEDELKSHLSDIKDEVNNGKFRVLFIDDNGKETAMLVDFKNKDNPKIIEESISEGIKSNLAKFALICTLSGGIMSCQKPPLVKAEQQSSQEQLIDKSYSLNDLEVVKDTMLKREKSISSMNMSGSNRFIDPSIISEVIDTFKSGKYQYCYHCWGQPVYLSSPNGVDFSIRHGYFVITNLKRNIGYAYSPWDRSSVLINTEEDMYNDDPNLSKRPN